MLPYLWRFHRIELLQIFRIDSMTQEFGPILFFLFLIFLQSLFPCSSLDGLGGLFDSMSFSSCENFRRIDSPEYINVAYSKSRTVPNVCVLLHTQGSTCDRILSPTALYWTRVFIGILGIWLKTNIVSDETAIFGGLSLCLGLFGRWRALSWCQTACQGSWPFSIKGKSFHVCCIEETVYWGRRGFYFWMINSNSLFARQYQIYLKLSYFHSNQSVHFEWRKACRNASERLHPIL